MNTFPEWFKEFFALLEASEHGQRMKQTVEGSEWHREANTFVHTQMCLDFYWENIAPHRTVRQQTMTLLSLACHDLGKPEAEETVERKDGTGSYHRYAGHESISANEFMNFMVDHPKIVAFLKDAGLDWADLVKIKVMIEHHLPFGMTNLTKRSNLKTMLVSMLGEDYMQCFYDQLYADCCGRISDNHDQKKADVVEWIEAFKAVPLTPLKEPHPAMPTLYVLVGPSGIGKSTWVTALKKMNKFADVHVVSEDEYRLQFARANVPMAELVEWAELSTAEFYDKAWKFCHLSDASKAYEAFVKEKVQLAAKGAWPTVLDRTNTSRKNRGKFVTPFRDAGFRVEAVLFLASENLVNARQKGRGDKCVPPKSVHQQVMSTETPWVGVEVHGLEIVAP